MALLAKPDVSFIDVTRVLSTDAALSAEVLRLANSPLGGRFGAASILQAVSLLGVARISALVLTLTMSKVLRKAGQSEVVKRCWRHNLACALAAKLLSRDYDLDADQVYTAGLLHDVGRLGLLVGNREPYEAIIRSGSDTRLAEREQFGIDHCEAGAWILANWKLPFPYIETALRHHDEPDVACPLQSLVRIACLISTQIGFGITEQEPATECTVDSEFVYTVASTINAIEGEFGL